MFADDTKIYRRTFSQPGRVKLQQDLIKLQDWSDAWLLRFNTDKCKVMHFGGREDQGIFKLNGNNFRYQMLKKTLEYRYVTVCNHQNRVPKQQKELCLHWPYCKKHLGILMKRDSQFFTTPMYVPTWNIVFRLGPYIIRRTFKFLKKCKGGQQDSFQLLEHCHIENTVFCRILATVCGVEWNVYAAVFTPPKWCNCAYGFCTHESLLTKF